MKYHPKYVDRRKNNEGFGHVHGKVSDTPFCFVFFFFRKIFKNKIKIKNSQTCEFQFEFQFEAQTCEFANNNVYNIRFKVLIIFFQQFFGYQTHPENTNLKMQPKN